MNCSRCKADVVGNTYKTFTKNTKAHGKEEYVICIDCLSSIVFNLLHHDPGWVHFTDWLNKKIMSLDLIHECCKNNKSL